MLARRIAFALFADEYPADQERDVRIAGRLGTRPEYTTRYALILIEDL